MDSQYFKHVYDSIEQGLNVILESEQYRSYLKIMARFHSYSLNNIILIYQQCPQATYVAGYSAWITKFSRHVRKGEKGIRILAPYKGSTMDPKTGKEKEEIRFRIVTVFDISQTEGDPLPDFPVPKLCGNVDNYEKVMKILRLVSPVPVEMRQLRESVHGYYAPLKNRIVINEAMNEAQTVKTLIHEIAHAMLHHSRSSRAAVSSQQKEVEAESVAYAVCHYFGLDTSDFSFPYLAVYSGRDNTLLKNSMEAIQEASCMMINRINSLFLEDSCRPSFRKRAEEETEKILG